MEATLDRTAAAVVRPSHALPPGPMGTTPLAAGGRCRWTGRGGSHPRASPERVPVTLHVLMTLLPHLPAQGWLGVDFQSLPPPHPALPPAQIRVHKARGNSVLPRRTPFPSLVPCAPPPVCFPRSAVAERLTQGGRARRPLPRCPPRPRGPHSQKGPLVAAVGSWWCVQYPSPPAALLGSPLGGALGAGFEQRG